MDGRLTHMYARCHDDQSPIFYKSVSCYIKYRDGRVKKYTNDLVARNN